MGYGRLPGRFGQLHLKNVMNVVVTCNGMIMAMISSVGGVPETASLLESSGIMRAGA